MYYAKRIKRKMLYIIILISLRYYLLGTEFFDHETIMLFFHLMKTT